MNGVAWAAIILWVFLAGLWIGHRFAVFEQEWWWRRTGVSEAEDWANNPDDD